jgi:oligoribonuclease NrnB/cAMP/cGMP phosphodiesterase (DHH superfamily)
VKILNPGNDPVVIPKGKFISKFTELNKDYDIWRINPDDKQVNFVQNVALSKSVDDEGHANSTENLVSTS